MDEIAKQHVAYLTQDCQSERVQWNGYGNVFGHSGGLVWHGATDICLTRSARTVVDVQAAIIAMIDQVEAEEKARAAEAAKAQEAARPVMNAISAMHSSHRSDGRPHRYDDPLRKGE